MNVRLRAWLRRLCDVEHLPTQEDLSALRQRLDDVEAAALKRYEELDRGQRGLADFVVQSLTPRRAPMDVPDVE